jgi:hypothetical protein
MTNAHTDLAINQSSTRILERLYVYCSIAL